MNAATYLSSSMIKVALNFITFKFLCFKTSYLFGKNKKK